MSPKVRAKEEARAKAKERRLRRAREAGAGVPETRAKAESEHSYYGPLRRRVFKRLAEYHSQLVCRDLTVSLSSFVHC